MKLCECGCGGETNWDKWRNKYSRFIRGHSSRDPNTVLLDGVWVQKEVLINGWPLCACGCGEKVDDPKNEFIHSHNLRVIPSWNTGKIFYNDEWVDKLSVESEIPFCLCGCGEKVKTIKHTYIDGHQSIGRELSEETRAKISEANKNRPPVSDKTRQLLSEAGMGHEVSDETRAKISEAHMGMRHSPEVIAQIVKTRRDNGNYGYTVEQREKQSLAMTKAILDGTRKFGNTHKNGHFFSKKNNKKLWYRSSYELVAYNILEQMSKVLKYKVEPFRISYFYDGINRNTIPDLLITYTDGTKELIEVKASYMLEDELTQAKFEAMKNHAVNNNMDFSIWTETDLGLNN